MSYNLTRSTYPRFLVVLDYQGERFLFLWCRGGKISLKYQNLMFVLACLLRHGQVDMINSKAL